MSSFENFRFIIKLDFGPDLGLTATVGVKTCTSVAEVSVILEAGFVGIGTMITGADSGGTALVVLGACCVEEVASLTTGDFTTCMSQILS